MRVLLDTNIIIHRENIHVSNSSIGLLFYWLDKLHYEKLIHPLTVKELRKYKDSSMQDLLDVKLSSYTEMKTIAKQDEEFKEQLRDTVKTENDEIDNQLLYEVYCGRADILITEDRRMRNKASSIGIVEKVYSVDAFIEKESSKNPELITYKVLSVQKEYFGNIDFTSDFFNSLRDSYEKFDDWFAKKCDEEAYICYSDEKQILGFLYLKTEDKGTDYSDIRPIFEPCRRLKVGTFKVESTGFRLGERFLKIIFDNAIKRNVDEIYVTLFEDNTEQKALGALLRKWGFVEYGEKIHKVKNEKVLVKKMKKYNKCLSLKENYPNVNYAPNKYILPIYPQYHTALLPDSKLRTEKEIDYIDDIAHRYALEKVYITWGMKAQVKTGDIVLFYRMGDCSPKKYSSVVTTVGIVEEIWGQFNNKDEFLMHCENRSVFKRRELDGFWEKNRRNICVVKFLYVCSLEKKVQLAFLWNAGIVEAPNGPRPFTEITDSQFEMIIKESKTDLYGIGDGNE